MVKYRLHYFPIRGKAEVTRLLFAYARVEYEDIRIPPDEWPKMKADMPFGQMPVLEVDGVKLCQSAAINRYLAREFKVNGKDNMEEYYIDMFCCCMEDIGQKFPFGEKDEKKKLELMKNFYDVILPEMLGKIEKMLIAYNGGDGYFASKLSIADLYLMNTVDFFIPKKEDMLSLTPKLAKLYDRVKNEPKLKAWIDKRPRTEY